MTSLLTQNPTTPTTSEYPNDRLPSEQVVVEYALRGYRGPTVLISQERYFGSKQADRFIYEHQHTMRERGWPVAETFVLQDCQTLTNLADCSDAVRVIPAY